MKDKYFLLTPGRSKSHMIVTYLVRHGYHAIYLDPLTDRWYSREHHRVYDRERELVIHYHGKTFIPSNPKDYTVILNHRKDIFAQYCSHALSRATGCYTQYFGYDKDLRVEIDMKDAVENCRYLYDHFIDIERDILKDRPWRKIVKIDYEDIDDNYQSLFDLLPLPRKKHDQSHTELAEKSPYCVEKHILNYYKIREQFKIDFQAAHGIKL